jgi:hypothetical protein
MAGVKPWKGNRKPVTLVAAVVTRNRIVHASSRFDVRSPYATTRPEPIPARLINTCMNVKVGIPRTIIPHHNHGYFV